MFENGLENLGQNAELIIRHFGRQVIFFFRVLKTALTTKPYLDRVLIQTYIIGIGSLPVVILINAFMGSTLCLEFWDTYMSVGAGDTVGIYMTYAIMREVGPLMTGALVGAKSGAEMAATLAAMKVREQIDAVEVMGVDPIRYLVVPRLIALVSVMPFLMIIGNAVALATGYLVFVYQLGGFGGTYEKNFADWARLADLSAGIIKVEVMALAILAISAFEGFNSQPGSEGVGRATNRTVVRSSVYVAMLNMLLSLIIYGHDYLSF